MKILKSVKEPIAQMPISNRVSIRNKNSFKKLAMTVLPMIQANTSSMEIATSEMVSGYTHLKWVTKIGER